MVDGNSSKLYRRDSKSLHQCMKTHGLSRSRQSLVPTFSLIAPLCRLNTDIKFGKNCGFRTLFVLTGAHTVDDMRKYQASNSVEDQTYVPDYYTNRVGDILQYLQ